MSKEQWINSWKEYVQTKLKISYSKEIQEVIEFIANILYHDENDRERTIYKLFACGYCYYFAVILMIAFNRGSVRWHKGYGHIVWLDTNDIAYDIGGIFEDWHDIKDTDGEKDDLVPVSELGNKLEYFKHTAIVDENRFTTIDAKKLELLTYNYQ